MKKQIWLFISVGIIASVVAAPVVLYFWNFRRSNMSADPQLWGVLGDYLGGVLNPIIALANLVIFGYLTFLVAKQTSRESKNLFILERRMAAYDELIKHFRLINSYKARMDIAMSLMPIYSKLPTDQGLTHIIKVFEELRDINRGYQDFYETLFEFRPRYSHLFKYDFKSKEFSELLEETKKVRDRMLKLVNDVNALTPEDRGETTLPVKFTQLAADVVIAIRNEIDLDIK